MENFKKKQQPEIARSSFNLQKALDTSKQERQGPCLPELYCA